MRSRKLDWRPTQQGRQAIRDVLKPWGGNLRPDWADATDSGPLYGDPNEGVVHRTGVEIAGRMFPAMPWAEDIENVSPTLIVPIEPIYTPPQRGGSESVINRL